MPITAEFIYFCLFCVGLVSVVAVDTQGTVYLDSWTFDKVISKFQATLVKFDVPYPYGEKHDEFAKVGEDLRAVPELLIGQVGVKDYGDKENSDLAEKYGIKKDDLPVLKLFKQSTDQPISFESDKFKADEIKKFIKQHTGLYIGLSSCIKEFDDYAASFMKADKGKREEILKKAEAAAKVLADKEQKSAETYLKIMRKIVEKGVEFVASELDRVQTIQKGKITKEKKEEIQSRINILQSFRIRDEL